MSHEAALTAPPDSVRRAQEDHWSIRGTLILLATLSVGVLVVVPLANVFYNALSNGPAAYWKNLFGDPDTRHAILLTLVVAPTAVVANVIFGVAAAWLIARFRFPGRTLLTTLIDLPFSVSPVVAGLVFVLIFGLQGYLGPWLREHGIKIIFATPGLILATAFVTFPFVARELIPLMEAIGSEEDVAAVSLGARGWQMFRRVTLPNIKWGLIYGVILCSARAMGEFGAVYVVSGHIAGQTDTLPLRVEKLFQEYNTPGSFAVASLLTSLALVTLALKTAAEWKTRSDLANRRRESLAGESSAGATPLRRDSSRPRVVPSSDLGAGRLVERREREAHVGITVDNVTKRFGNFVALDGIHLEIPDGELLALLGPSGCGKTTLLRIIAGLDVPTAGTIRYHDEDATHRHARERNVGFVFQHYALFRHMSVFENVAFGLRVRGAAADAIKDRVHELLRLVQLDGLEGQSPTQLSGGQRQRVALARALAAEPKVLLLDEPFGALDARVRKELRQWLRRLHDEIHVTSVFVTHDQEEAFEVADRVVVMNHGRIEQIGTPEQVFEHPASPFILDFLGNVNVFHGRAEAGRAFLAALDHAYAGRSHDELESVTAYVRPHELEIDRASGGQASVKAEVVRINAASAAVRVELMAEDFGVPIHVELARERHAQLRLRTGDRVYVHPKNARVFIEDYQI